MVAYLQDGGVDDDRITTKTSEKPKPAGLPLTHEAALKWFYKDPQGEIQGETWSINVIYTHTNMLNLSLFPLNCFPTLVLLQVPSVTRR